MKIIITTNDYEIQVSDWRYEYLNHWKWNFAAEGYVTRSEYSEGKTTTIFMSHVILDLQNIAHPEDVDHADQNKLNYQDDNLRPLTRQQNSMNRGPNKNNKSGYKGVSIDSRNNKWMAQIMKDGKTIHLGYFGLAEDAAKAYDCKALELFGNVAILNFPGNYVKFD